MADFLDTAAVKDNNQITVTTKVRGVLKVKQGDHLAFFKLDEYPDAVLVKKLETTIEPVTAQSSKKSR